MLYTVANETSTIWEISLGVCFYPYNSVWIFCLFDNCDINSIKNSNILLKDTEKTTHSDDFTNIEKEKLYTKNFSAVE